MSSVTPFDRNNIALFQPNQVAGLALWLDAADSASVVRTGSSVTRWNDKSGNGYNASAFGTPTYVNNAVNGLSAVRFNGTSSYFSIPGNQLDIATEDFAIFAVVQYTLSSIELPIIGKGTGVLATQQWRLNFGLTNQFGITLWKNGVQVASSATYTKAGWGLFSGVVYRATTFEAFTNGTGLGQSSSASIVGSLSDTATNVEIGRGWSGPTKFFNSDMGEILLYKGTITASQRQQIESYLAYKWGLQRSLPTNHPYYNSPYNAIANFTNLNQITKFAYPILPNQVAGLGLWLDAADGNSVAQVGGVVSQWNDKSGSNNHATQITVGNRPRYTNSFVSLNGVDQFFNVNLDFLAGVSHNFFIVLRNFNYTNIYGAANGGLSQNSLHIGFANSAAYRMNYWGNDFQPATTANYKVSQINLLNYNWVNNATKTIYANGSLEATLAQPGIIGTMSGGGRIANVVGQGFLSANIYEILIYTGTITVDQRQAIEGYLAWKWGLQTNLPVTQPYYNNAFIANLPRPIPTNIQQYQYNPQIISGLALWLDAADSVTVIRTGANVTGWNDKSGNNNNGTAFGTGSPTYSSNSITFTGGQAFSTTLSSLIPNQSGFAVVNYTSASKIDIISLTKTGANLPAGIQQIIQNNIPLITTYGGTTIVTGGTLTQNTILLYNYTFGATTNAFIYANGSQTATTTGPYSLTGTGTVNIGGYDTSPGEGFIGSMYEVILFNVVLTTNQRQQIEGYLAWKWGLQANLPANHPNKLYPPG